ncbi:MAG: hypothetical protein ACYSVY_10655 [Planctomycetota bacterium]|jgi:hypothetical protein
MRLRLKELITAALAGGGLGLVHNTIPGDGTAGLQIGLFYLGLFPLTVLFLSRPLDTYRHSCAISVVTVLGWITVKFVTEAITAEYGETALWMSLFWGFYGLLGLIANVLTVSAAVWARRHFYPIYGVGFCQRCGYDLTGNASGICPECGASRKGDAIPTQSIERKRSTRGKWVVASLVLKLAADAGVVLWYLDHLALLDLPTMLAPPVTFLGLLAWLWYGLAGFVMVVWSIEARLLHRFLLTGLWAGNALVIRYMSMLAAIDDPLGALCILVCGSVSFLLLLSTGVRAGDQLISKWMGPRYPKGCCQGCGYDLTGNVSGVCPECGAAV